MGIKGMVDLEKHYAFYGAYHRHRVNVLMHTLFVWPLFFSFLVLFYFTPPICSLFFTVPPKCFLTSHGLLLNLGFFLALCYAVTFVCLDPKAGSLAAVLCFACWVSASLLAQRLGFSLSWKFFLASQVICWAGQSIGHGVFEKRAPSSNMAQAFVMAPFFVFLEVLQTICGYEPYAGFNRSVKEKIEAEIKQWQSKAPSEKKAA
ncbi:hypothetical protein BT93_K0088 [Corymbia citriodora subsp. variegata]|nr:hypothetical protein BT93_K0088 [Corymbia citriodora subsp. variegata]